MSRYKKKIPEVFDNLDPEILKMRKRAACCIGFQRTGSTVAWQIGANILKKDIVKSHEASENRLIGSILYTYRDPRDVFISMKRINKEIKIDFINAKLIEIHKKMNHIKEDREVLFLKYEDYYSEPRDRIKKISSFLGFDNIICDNIVEIIHKNTSIESNIEKMNRLSNFDDIDHDFNIHGNHIGPEKGRLESWRGFDNVDFSKLRESIVFLGYSI